MTSAANPWLSARAGTGDARVRLFCLPHAGAGTSAYNLWKRLLPAFIEVCPVHIPGRESRLAECSIIDSPTLIAGIAGALSGHLDLPYAIFGHSMGALLALDLAFSLRAAGCPEPGYLFVSGRNATHMPIRQSELHRLPDADLLEALAIRYGGLPQEILETPELLELYLPILRADLTLLETHCYAQHPPLDCPIAAFAGGDDANVTPEGLAAWGDHTTAGFETRLFDGGHFYLNGPSRPALLGLIAERLAAVPSRGARYG
jgi:medium-chain acyl-[acyl-carrier-protein] hydrolase